VIRISGIGVILLFVACSATKIPSQREVSPRVFAGDANALVINKKKVLSKDASLMPAFAQLLKEADSALTEGPFSVMEKKHTPPSGDKHDYMSLAPYHWPDPSKPNGLPYIRKDGQTTPEVKEYLDKEYMPKTIKLVNTLAQAYYFSNDERYAKHAALLLRTWFIDPKTKMNPNLNYAQAIKGVNEGRGAGIIDARHFVKAVDAIGLLQSSKHWSQQDQSDIKKWFGDFLDWLETSKNGIDESDAPNNHGTWYDALRLSIALFTGNTEAAKKIVASAQSRLDQQMDVSGKFPKEMERTISLHYSSFNLEAFFHIAQMAEHVEIDFWNYTSPKGSSLRKGFHVLKPYLTGQKVWDGQQIKSFDFEEDAYPILTMAATKYNCKDCKNAIVKLAGKKAAQLRLNLLYKDIF
jgi:hypothetical protein